MSIFAGIAARKLTNVSAVIFPYPCQSRWFIFTKQIIVLFWVIIFFKVGVFKTHYTIHRKTTVSESLFIQPVACCFFNKRLWCFLVDIAKLSITPFLQKHLETPDSVFMEHICDYNIIKFNVNYPKCLFEPFETLIKIEMYICEIKIMWTWEIILSSLLILWNLLLSVVNPFMMEVPIIYKTVHWFLQNSIPIY